MRIFELRELHREVSGQIVVGGRRITLPGGRRALAARVRDRPLAQVLFAFIAAGPQFRSDGPRPRSLSTSGGSGPRARLVGVLVRTRAERFDLRDSVHRWHTDAPHEPRPGQAKGDTGASLRASHRDLLSAAVAPRGMGRRPTTPCGARDARAPALQSQACPQATRHGDALRARTRGHSRGQSRAPRPAIPTQAPTAETQGLPGPLRRHRQVPAHR